VPGPKADHFRNGSDSAVHSVSTLLRFHAIDARGRTLQHDRGRRAGSAGWLETRGLDQGKQALIGAIRDSDRQRLFVKSSDIAGDEVSQPAQGTLLGLVPAERFKRLLEYLEGSQAVMLLRKPRVQFV
jgi:hypothetical protein